MDGIIPLTAKHISQAKKLSDAEGWNQTGKDWELLVTAPGNICLAYASGEKIIATATAMTYEKELAWIGMVLVDCKYRGQGLSKLLLTALLNNLKSFKSVKLDATPAGQPVYQKLGFKNEYLVYRMISHAVSLETLSAFKQSSVESIDVAGISDISKYDQQVTGINRRVLLEYLAGTCPKSSLVIKNQGIIQGFLMGRAGASFHQLGPLVAGSVEDAKHLLAEALFGYAGHPVVIDVPEHKEEIIGWMKSAGFIIQRHFMRMYLNNKSPFGMPENNFLTGGPEFG